MARKKCFVSFDYDNDRHYKFLLEAWDANPRFEFVFTDYTPREIDSERVDRVKAALTVKIKGATHTLVIVGREANKLHRDHRLIGFRNWQNFEVHQSKVWRNRIAAIKLETRYDSPEELLGAGASWAKTFAQEAILRALDSA